MGLDISYYENAEPVSEDDLPDGIEDERQQYIEDNNIIDYFTLKGYEARLEGIDAKYVEVDGKSGGFRAGSYGGYNQWRNRLSILALGVPASQVWMSEEQYKDAVFVDLINFADNEGVIGPVSSARLAEQFKSERQRLVQKLSDEDEWWLKLYDKWATAFETAANTGCVEFT